MGDETVPFSEVRARDRITFRGGCHMTGEVLAVVGAYNGKKMIEFQEEGATIHRYISCAAHRSVIRHGR